MTNTASYDWAKKIASLIAADTPLGAVLAGDKVYGNSPPLGTLYPYITIDSPQYDHWQMFKGSGWSAEETLSLWAKNPMTVRQIFGLLCDLFHNKRYALDHGNALLIRVRLVAVSPDTEPTLYHGIVKVSAKIL